MKTLPCPRCGNPKVVNTFCAACLRELHPLVDRVKDVSLSICVMSGKVKIGTGWEVLDINEAVQKVVEKSLVSKETIVEVVTQDLDQEFIDELHKPGLNRTVDVVTTVTGQVNDITPYSEEYEIPVTIKTTVSPRYAKIGTQYFEGVLQLRNDHKKVHRALSSLVAKQDGLAINKEVVQKRGIDYYFTDKQRMRQIAHELFNRFGGLMKENARLITYDKQRSKDVHRLTVLIEFPPFARGDVLVNDDSLVRVQGLGKKIRIQDLTTGKVTEKVYEPDKYSIAQVLSTKISQVSPEVAIISPETFQQQKLYFHTKGGAPEFVVDQEVFVVLFRNRWWLVSARNSG